MRPPPTKLPANCSRQQTPSQPEVSCEHCSVRIRKNFATEDLSAFITTKRSHADTFHQNATQKLQYAAASVARSIQWCTKYMHAYTCPLGPVGISQQTMRQRDTYKERSPNLSQAILNCAKFDSGGRSDSRSTLGAKTPQVYRYLVRRYAINLLLPSIKPHIHRRVSP